MKLKTVRILLGPVALALGLSVSAAPAAMGGSAAPQPNPLSPVAAGGNPIYAPVPGVDITKNGPAASIHGDPASGRKLFAQNCTPCHGDRGLGNVPNPGSNDGTVPPLNPIDPGFVSDSQGDPAAFAKDIDLFVQHGSRPASPDGQNPNVSMIGWGDQKLKTQQELADIEAYVMEMNGIYWPDRWQAPAGVEVDAQQSMVRGLNTITYTVNIVNHSVNPLFNVVLSDALPYGLTPVDSGVPGLGQNPGAVAGNTVSFMMDQTQVPQGGILGPFVIVARTVPGVPTPANVVQVTFNWTNWNGTVFSTSAVSDPTLPAKPKAPAAPAGLPTLPSPAPAASAPASASPAPAASAPASAAPAPAASAQASPSPAPASAAPAPAPAAPQTYGDQIVEPQPGALSWGYSPSALTIHVGDTVSWTNSGSLGHTVTADDGSFDSGTLNSGDSWSFQFTSPGTYSFHCTPHPWMKGTVTVQ